MDILDTDLKAVGSYSIIKYMKSSGSLYEGEILHSKYLSKNTKVIYIKNDIVEEILIDGSSYHLILYYHIILAKEEKEVEEVIRSNKKEVVKIKSKAFNGLKF